MKVEIDLDRRRAYRTGCMRESGIRTSGRIQLLGTSVNKGKKGRLTPCDRFGLVASGT
jgi:hypothetical protein